MAGGTHLSGANSDRAIAATDTRPWRDQWDDKPVSVIMRSDLPTGQAAGSSRRAHRAQHADVDCLAVTTYQGVFVGELRTSEIMKLDEILGSAD